jgi:hypothetical protein
MHSAIVGERPIFFNSREQNFDLRVRLVNLENGDKVFTMEKPEES